MPVFQFRNTRPRFFSWSPHKPESEAGVGRWDKMKGLTVTIHEQTKVGNNDENRIVSDSLLKHADKCLDF